MKNNEQKKDYFYVYALENNGEFGISYYKILGYYATREIAEKHRTADEREQSVSRIKVYLK